MKDPIRKLALIGGLVVLLGMGLDHKGYPSERKNVIFIHHSVGESLIKDGSVREILTEAGLDFWDHGYNHPEFGLRNGRGEPAGCYWIPDDNTDPDGIANLLKLDPQSDNPLRKILNGHDVILFKSCFPNSQISEDNLSKDLADPRRRSLYNYRRHYLSIRQSIDKYPTKIFIIVTQPPMHPKDTNDEEARRARTFVEWLKSPEYLGGRKNLFVFDYFSLLTDPKTNMLRTEYQIDPQKRESHPNSIAQMIAGVHLADFIVNTINFGRHSKLAKVAFDSSTWPNHLMRSSASVTHLTGRIIINGNEIKRITWSDLKGETGELQARKLWAIRDIKLKPGVTKVLVTAVNGEGLRSSSAIGLQYYTGSAHQDIIFEKNLRCGSLDGFHSSYDNPPAGTQKLVIEGTGKPQRLAINWVNLDLSDFDPENTYLEIEYGQSGDGGEAELFLAGVGSYIWLPDNQSGTKRLKVPFKNFVYVRNILDHLVIRGIWPEKVKVYIDSIRLVCRGKKE